MICPASNIDIIRCNQILNQAEISIKNQGVVSFRFAQIAKDSGCSTNTLYKYFESKEDILVCLFLRNTASTRIPDFIKENPQLSINERAVLSLLFTFELIKRSPIFNILRLVSINSMFWQLASPDKISILKNRVNLFWSCIRNPLDDAVAAGKLSANELELKELTQEMYFFLAGATSSYQSGLMEDCYLTADDATCFRHISRIMNRYNWNQPITQEMMESLAMRISQFLDYGQGKNRTCETCLATGKSQNCKSMQ
ncbi:TetR/AcrR family transcriptional regulator [Shewanella japonica]|uniref:TetR family transcriptional regulator n=1 Tax=Shewanella japonica TaxID=93973 RepID=A0ABM6JHU9_9GAMM|nr:TetR/AcrR family transcriptional regulator [Shewanella japonica]ARD20876.1 TetR family transcriptional regulator [Shewanella japonica]